MKSTLLASMICLITGAAHAGMVVDVLDTNLAPGSSGFVDVMIRFDSTGSNVLSSYGLSLQITQVGSTIGQLQFADPQTDSQASLPTYLLSGDSLGVTSSLSTVNWTNDNYFGTDTTASSGVAVPTTESLLVRLDLNTSLTHGGDQFLISLVSADSSYTDADLISAFAFSSASHDGLITISTVPEPGTCTLIVLGGVGCLLLRRRRLEKKEPSRTITQG